MTVDKDEVRSALEQKGLRLQRVGLDLSAFGAVVLNNASTYRNQAPYAQEERLKKTHDAMLNTLRQVHETLGLEPPKLTPSQSNEIQEELRELLEDLDAGSKLNPTMRPRPRRSVALLDELVDFVIDILDPNGAKPAPSHMDPSRNPHNLRAKYGRSLERSAGVQESLRAHGARSLDTMLNEELVLGTHVLEGYLLQLAHQLDIEALEYGSLDYGREHSPEVRRAMSIDIPRLSLVDGVKG